MKRLVVFIFLMVGLVHCSFSQSEYIRRGRSGIGGSAGISINKEINGSIFYAGFSYKGFLDMGLSYWKANDERLYDEIFTPSITYYPVKQEDARIAPTLGISVGYNHYKSKSIALVDIPDPNMERRMDTIKKDLTVDAVKLGINAYHKIAYLKGSYFQLMVGTDISITNSGCEFVLRSGIAVGSRIWGWPLLVFMPSIEYHTSATTFFLTFGIVS